MPSVGKMSRGICRSARTEPSAMAITTTRIVKGRRSANRTRFMFSEAIWDSGKNGKSFCPPTGRLGRQHQKEMLAPWRLSPSCFLFVSRFLDHFLMELLDLLPDQSQYLSALAR